MSAIGDRNLDKKPKKRRYSDGASTTADWTTANAELLRDCIAAVTKDGSALRFGYSRDGGAFAIGIYENGEAYTVWCRPSEDIDQKLRSILESFE